jgi:hypothetical protein
MLAPDRWLKRGWRAFVLNAGAFAGATFILALAAGFPAGLLCFPLGVGPVGLSAGLLVVPLGLGLLEMALRARRGEAVAAREVIRGFRFFGPGLLLWLVVVAASLTVSACGHVPVVGALTGVIAGPLLNLFGVLAALCIVDRGSGVREALGRVLLVAERNWVGLWAVSLLFMFLESLGGFFFGIGILVTVPWIACSWAAAYQDLFERA